MKQMTCVAIVRNVLISCEADIKSDFGDMLERFCETFWKGVDEVSHTKLFKKLNQPTGCVSNFKGTSISKYNTSNATQQ